MDSDVASDDSTVHSDGESAREMEKATTPQPPDRLNAQPNHEEIMRVFLEHKSKKYSLRRHLQLSIGPRQQVIWAMMQMTFKDFCQYTHTHPCDILYDVKKCHHYVTVKPGIWPPNLYIRLKDLSKYLLAKGIILHEFDLRCVPPVFLHWCDLVKVTDFDRCVQYDYYKATAKKRMSVECLRSRREEFYQRCWEAGEWVWRAPVVTDNRLLRRNRESSISATPNKPVKKVLHAEGLVETNAAAINSIALDACEATSEQLQEDVTMDGPEDLVSAPEDLVSAPEDLVSTPEDLVSAPEDLVSAPEDLVSPAEETSPSVPSQSRIQGERLLDSSAASPSIDGTAVSSRQPFAGIPQTDSPEVALQPAEAKGYIIAAGAHLHTHVIMRSIRARVSDTTKHSEILERVQNVILRHRRRKENGPEAAEETAERHAVIVQQSSPNDQEETTSGEMLSPLTAKLPKVPFETQQKSLHHHLRLALGPKQHIIWAILQMTFEEFLQYTRIYPHETLLGDLRTAGDWHRNAIAVCGSWPENLYLRLEDLREYLLGKGLRLHAMDDLRCVTPIVLHWSDLMQSTNFDQCVQYDYYRETGRRRMSQATLRERREAHYRRCCDAGDWLGRAPSVTDAAVLEQFRMPEGEPGRRQSEIRAVSPQVEVTQQTTDPSPNEITAQQLQDPTLSGADSTVITAKAASPQQSVTAIRWSDCSVPPLVQNTEHPITADEACDLSASPLPAQSILLNMSQGSILLIPPNGGHSDTTRPPPENNSPTEAEHPDSTQSNEEALNTSTATSLDAAEQFLDCSGITDSDLGNDTRSGPFLNIPANTPIDEMTCSLHHHVRLAIGPKQAIIWAMLQMSFDEFRQYTRIHPRGRDKRCNTQMWRLIYKHALRKPGIWPPGLYIRLGDLREYLQRKEVLLHRWDLRCVSPQFLHWTDLLGTTNFDQCVQYYHYRTEGSTRLPAALLPEKRQEFYYRCWEAGEWLWRTPHVTDPQLRQQMLEANDLKSPSRVPAASDCAEKQTAAADSPKRSAPLNAPPSRQGCDLATVHGRSTNESEQQTASNLSEGPPEGANAETKAVRKQRKLPEGFLAAPSGGPPKKKRKAAKKKLVETMVPQLTHQYKPLPVNVVKKKDHPANGNVLADISNNNAVDAVTPSTEASEWTPSQAFAADNTLFNTSALVRVADQAGDGNSLPPRAAPQVIACLNSQPDVPLRVETEIFFHDLQRFDYYHALTYDQIQRDLLYETEIGKRYVQAKINYGGRSTKVYGDFLASLFSSCSPKLLADFQYVLASLGEYHYKVFKRREHVDEDQRRRVLGSFLRTRSVVARCKLKFDSATREYAKAFRVEGYASQGEASQGRASQGKASQGEAPAKKLPLARAIKPHILEEIKLLKAKLARE